MSQSELNVQRHEREELARAIKSLRESEIKFCGPFASSKGELIVIEDTILTVYEVLELFSKGQLNRDSIRKLLDD